MGEIRIGICQLGSSIAREGYDPRPENLERALTAIKRAADDGAELLVFGEGYLNGYESEHFLPRYAVAESATDPFLVPLVEIAKKRNLHIIIGATTHKGSFPGDVFNSALVLGAGRLIGVYSKTHVAAFTFDGGRLAAEKAYWSPGYELPVFDTALGRIGIEICYDIWFPEVARTLTLKGAELIVNVSAAVCGFETSWDHMLFARSLENTVFYLHVSVVGKQRAFECFGGSRLYSPLGEVLFEAPRMEEAVAVTTLDKQLLIEARGQLHTFYNRNPRLYEPIVADNRVATAYAVGGEPSPPPNGRVAVPQGAPAARDA